MAGEYIYTMNGLSKSYGHKIILKDIHLSFYHGAKIGIVGNNGSGKSTLLRIMAQQDENFDGHAKPLEGTRIGFLQQEPYLEPGKPYVRS